MTAEYNLFMKTLLKGFGWAKLLKNIPGFSENLIQGPSAALIVNPPRRRNGHDPASRVPHHAGETIPHTLFIVYHEHVL
jgi:hypothetical protein